MSKMCPECCGYLGVVERGDPGACTCEEVDEEHDELRERVVQLEAENHRLKEWVNDLQCGMYINCVYCGHRYGAQKDVPAAMADVLKEHIERCPVHPMSTQKAENEQRKAALERLIYEITSLSPTEDDGSRWCKISAEALQKARVAYWQNPEGKRPEPMEGRER